MKSHLYSRHVKYCGIALALLMVLSRLGHTQDAIDITDVNTTLTRLIQSPFFPQEAEIKIAAEGLSSKHGRIAAASMLAAYARDQVADVTQLHAARLMGSHIRPEFEAAVVQAIKANKEPQGTGRMLLLLRSSDATVIPSLADLLQDTRVAEKLSKRADAEGSRAFRVCDIAHNVIQEIRIEGKNQSRPLTRDGNITIRDGQIATLYKELMPGAASTEHRDAVTLEMPSITPPSPASKPLRVKSVQPLTSEEQPSSTSWLVWGAIIVAAIGLLWLLVKNRK